jgi:hypothetical protein
MVGNCDHSGFHSGLGKMAHDFCSIRFVLICDDCGQETREVHVEDYAPARDASGGDAHPARHAA